MNITKIIILFSLVAFTKHHSQEALSDSIQKEKIHDIEEVIFNDRDYKKVNYNFALKKTS